LLSDSVIFSIESGPQWEEEPVAGEHTKTGRKPPTGEMH